MPDKEGCIDYYSHRIAQCRDKQDWGKAGAALEFGADGGAGNVADRSRRSDKTDDGRVMFWWGLAQGVGLEEGRCHIHKCAA